MSEPSPYADRSYRSPAGIFGGVLLLALTLWLGTDALLRGDGRVPFVALSAMLMVAPVIVAFALRPAVFASDAALRVRNPFRTVVAPWSKVDAVRAGYSCEVIADGEKYQLWSIPVSLRARSKASRHNRRLASGEPPARGPFGMGSSGADDNQERVAPSDAAVRELRELAERNRDKPDAKGEVTVSWAFELIIPAALGTIGVLILWLSA